MPNQHVVPNNGQWAVRPEGGSRVTARTRRRRKPSRLLARFLKISEANCSSMGVTAGFANVIVTVMTLARHEDNNTKQAVSGN